MSVTNIGAVPNDGTGDPLRVGMGKVNDAFQNITNNVIPPNTVIESMISDGAVSAIKLASNAVTSAKIADGAIETKLGYQPAPLFTTRTAASAATIPAAVPSLVVQFRAPSYAIPATLIGGAIYSRISLADLTGFPASSYFRSADRFMPDGTTNSTNGGYWVISRDQTVNVSMLGAMGNGTADDSSAINDAITLVNLYGGGYVDFSAGTFMVQNIVLKSLVRLRGQGKQATTLKLRPYSGINTEIIYTENFFTLFNTNAAAGAYPWRMGLIGMTLDGNYFQNTTNPAGRGFLHYGSGLYISDVLIKNCARCGFVSEAPVGGGGAWPRPQDESSGETHAKDFNVQYCNRARDPDVVNNMGGGGVYYNGPTDARFDQFIIGWCQGGYGLKIGPKGAMRHLGGEIFGGMGVLDVDNAVGSSITRVGTTATVIATGHGLRVGEQFVIYGAMDAIFKNYSTVATVPDANTFTFTLDSATGANFSGIVTVAKALFPQFGVISECQNGWTGTDVNLSGGYAGQALIRKNGFRHFTRHNYTVAGDGTTARIIQKGYTIGDPANGFTNVAGVFIDAVQEDILGPCVDFASSGGNNTIKIRGYCNYSGMSIAPTGTPNAADEYDIQIGGATSVVAIKEPNDNWTTWTPTVTATGGSGGTTGTNSGRFKVQRREVTVKLTIPVTGIGTWTGDLTATLPAGYTPLQSGALVGVETGGTNKGLRGRLIAGDNKVYIRAADGAFPAATTLELSGSYEI